MKKALILILISLIATGLTAQNRKVELSPVKSMDKKNITLSDEYLDTVTIDKKAKINDYSMIGFHYGVGLSRVLWNPTQKQDMVFMPYNFGITFTKYGKMFGYMPYFGFQAGILLTQEGYQFKYNEDRNYTYKIQGAEKAVMDVIEVPVMAHMHFDVWNMKILANIGCYGGYRLAIERFPGVTGTVAEEVAHTFLETDRRVDYGIKGGIGVGYIFDPFEVHIQALYKHSLGSLYDPDHYSEYYYRFAYPSNIIITAGIHFQLTKRTGKTKAELKKQAKDMVYGNTESNGW